MDASPSLSSADLYARARAKVPVKLRLRAGAIARRRPWVTALLAVVTGGVYGLFWLYLVSRELRDTTAHQEIRPARDVALTVLTLGLYGVVVVHRQSRTIHAISRYFVRSHDDRSAETLVFALGGLLTLGLLGVGAIAVVQRQMNELADLTDGRERDRERLRKKERESAARLADAGAPSSATLEAAADVRDR